jgi:hypothetical protein
MSVKDGAGFLMPLLSRQLTIPQVFLSSSSHQDLPSRPWDQFPVQAEAVIPQGEAVILK